MFFLFFLVLKLEKDQSQFKQRKQFKIDEGISNLIGHRFVFMVQEAVTLSARFILIHYERHYRERTYFHNIHKTAVVYVSFYLYIFKREMSNLSSN